MGFGSQLMANRVAVGVARHMSPCGRMDDTIQLGATLAGGLQSRLGESQIRKPLFADERDQLRQQKPLFRYD